MSLSHHLFRCGVLGGSVVDHLASQGSLAYEHEKDRLIAVNAGSNTITVRAVNGYRLLRRQVLPTLGSFRSPRRRTATSSTCSTPATAARSRATAALARCWRRSQRGTALGLEPNATPEFLTTPGQVAFTPEGGKLLVTTKGNTGAIEVFNVNARRLRRALLGWVRWPRPRPS